MIYPELNNFKDDLLLGDEVWKDVVDWEGLYSVSNLGRVRRENWAIPRCDSIRVLKAIPASKRYPKVTLCGTHRGKDKSVRSVHRLVAEAFVPNPENKPQIHHINSDVMDARACNLEWTTQSENIGYAFKEGRKVTNKGESSNFNKYNESFVRLVYGDILLGEHTQKELSDSYNVNQTYISSLKTKKIWKDLTDLIDKEVSIN